ALGLDVGTHEADVLARVKEMENKGFQMEAADGTVELVMRRVQDGYKPPFELVDVLAVSLSDIHHGMLAKATVNLRVEADVITTEAQGKGPVDALDSAVRRALVPHFAELERLRLIDYKVRILDPQNGTAATTRVLLEAAHGDARWITVGCSVNIIEASCQALLDSFELCVLRERSLRGAGATTGIAKEVAS
ncbi:MAG: citramalate synthase, partial [Myxococcota bacterium]|nr:citramalate synthase [Myxococcota bacterium]